MNNTITEKLLKEKGFTEYTKSSFDSSSVDHVYQKMYRDKIGKKYFINVKHYKMYHPATFEDLSGYEVSTQVYLKENHNAINLDFIDSDIDEAESVIDKLFEIGLLDYYEKWD